MNLGNSGYRISNGFDAPSTILEHCSSEFKEVFDRADSVYKNSEIELAAYTSCGGCPGGNIEYAPEEMKKNGVTHVHFATGFLVGYPPCPYIEHFQKIIPEKFGMKVVLGTHPIPQKYFITHNRLNTWHSEFLKEDILPTLSDESTRLNYD